MANFYGWMGNRKKKGPPPNKQGKLKGFCKRCGMMIIEGEETCPTALCYCKEVQSTPPTPKERLVPKNCFMR